MNHPDGLRHLHTEDGGTWLTDGHRVLRLRPSDVRNEYGFPMEDEDKPITSPQQEQDRAAAVVWTVLIFAACIAAALVWAGVVPVVPFN